MTIAATGTAGPGSRPNEPWVRRQRMATRPAREICETRSHAIHAASGCPLRDKGWPGAGSQISALPRQAACWHAVLS